MATGIDELLKQKGRLRAQDLFEREESKEQPKHRIFLSVEGNKTEVHYFKWLSAELATRYSVIITTLKHTKDGQNDPKHVLALLKEYSLRLDERYIDGELLQKARSRFNDEQIFDCLHNPAILDTSTLNEIEVFFKEHLYDVEEARRVLDLSSGDLLGMVIDRDRGTHSVKTLKECHDYCKKRGWHFYLNTPCFEFWLYLHLVEPKALTPEFLREAFLNKDITTHHTFISKQLSELAHHKKGITQPVFARHYFNNYPRALSNLKYCAHTIEELYDKAGSNLNEFFESIGIKADDQDDNTR